MVAGCGHLVSTRINRGWSQGGYEIDLDKAEKRYENKVGISN